MGLKMTISAQDNHMSYEFKDAYWKIEDIVFSNKEGASFVGFSLKAYPSREASKAVLKPIRRTEAIQEGGPYMGAYSPCLWTWQTLFRATEAFPNGIPVTESAQKDVLYQLVKTYTGLPFEDVIED